MVKKYLCVLCLCTLSIIAYSQRLSTGLHFGAGVMEILNRDNYYIFPDPTYTYNVYYGPKSLKNKYSGGSVGGYMQVDYKSFIGGLEVNVAHRRYWLSCYYAIKNNLGIEGQDRVEFEVKQSNTEINLFSGVKLFKRNKNIILYGGAIYTIVSSNDEEGRLNLNSGVGIAPFMGNNEMYNVMYNDFNYWRLMGAVGYSWKNSLLSFRYDYRINTGKAHITHNISGISLHYNYILNFQKLKKGHFIYQK